MFDESSKLVNIPFDINIKNNTSSSISLTHLFNDCNNLRNIPNVNNVRISATDRLFYRCYYIREIPESFYNTWNWSYINNLTSGYNGSQIEMFYGMYSLRELPITMLENGNPVVNYSYSIYYRFVNTCYSLNEIINLPFPHYNVSWTSNAFNVSFDKCSRLKNMTFKLQEDGTPYIMKWKNQVINLSVEVGYLTNSTYVLNYNSGITVDKEVKDDATYQALKDDPDWFSKDINYSRYNHDSAVRTINSLPDTSAYGTNTIKFKGASGALTDGGAINTLTEEEIAVATAKGWTVSLS